MQKTKEGSYISRKTGGDPKPVNIKRCEYLVKALAERYGVQEIEVADASVAATHKLLKEKYGIEQKIQETLEGVYKAKKWKDGKQGMDEMFVLYVSWVDKNQESR